MKTSYRIFRIVVFLVYVAVVAWLCFGKLSTIPHVPRKIWGIATDKIVHFLMFLPFPILGTIAFDFRSWWRPLAFTTLMANVIAFSFEKLQSIITSHRITDSADLNANFLGITVGLLIAIVIGLLAKRK